VADTLKQTRWHSCNVLHVHAEARQLWHFDARNGGFVLNRQETGFASDALPASIITKDWRSLFQRKLNIAWLSPEHVFLRVAQFPASDFAEVLAMVELQLEKFSPMPVAQIVWSIHLLPQAQGKLQTVVILMAARHDVEQFLGQLEGQGYLADRLELPLLDQLQAVPVSEDGAWIYPEASGGRNMALVAWWCGGVLQNLGLALLPTADRPAQLREQLLQMAWGGELEGWLTATPRWHLVADRPAAAEWETAIRQGLEEPLEVIQPMAPPELAALTARRAAQAGPAANLLPPEFASRYQQQFHDRLWMRGLLTTCALYLVGVLIYFAALQVLLIKTSSAEKQVAGLGPTYTTAVQTKARLGILKERTDLTFLALECWKKLAEVMPDSITLDSWNFSDGKKITLNGTAPADAGQQLLDFDAALRKTTDSRGQPMFDAERGDRVSWRGTGGTVTWNLSLELKRVEVL
jgi:hypothetical protein